MGKQKPSAFQSASHHNPGTSGRNGRRLSNLTPQVTLTIYEETVGFDGERLLDAQSVAWVSQAQFEVLQDDSNGEHHLLPGKWSSDTSSCTGSERLDEYQQNVVGPQTFMILAYLPS